MMVQLRSFIPTLRPTLCPTIAPPSRHPANRRSQIPIDRQAARHRRAMPARGFLPRAFSDACHPSMQHLSSAAGIQEALTFADLPLPPAERGGSTSNRPLTGVQRVSIVAAGATHRAGWLHQPMVAVSFHRCCRLRRDRGLHLAADNECQNTREKIPRLVRPRETVPPHPQS
jgi:hypothetical protein